MEHDVGLIELAAATRLYLSLCLALERRSALMFRGRADKWFPFSPEAKERSAMI